MTANREQFGSRLGFILAAAGSAVGIGNLVGFPVNAAKNGGAAFLLLYAIFVFFICLPVMMAELAAGRNSQKTPLGAYRHFSNNHKGWSIAGWLSLITPYMIAVFYSVITVWILGYFVAICMGNLQALTSPEYFGTFINSGNIFVYLIVITLFVGVILYSGVQDGIERGAKIMMPSLFIMLILLVFFVLTRENAMAGVKYYLIPDVSKITPQVINSAMGQAFFSLSLGMGILITYGSYMDRKANISGSAKMIALADTGVAFTAGLMVLPAIFSFNPNTNTAELSDSSVSLIFTFLPKIFLSMQASVGYVGASIVAAVFFLLVFFAALTSLVSIIEVPVSGLMDQKCYPRNKALAIVGATMVIVSIACAVSFGMVDFFTNFIPYGGQNKSFFDLVIDVFYDTILPLNGFLICLLVVYRWKKQQLNAELETGNTQYRNSLLERYTNFALGTFIPAILLLVFINTVLNKFFSISLI
ncbi:sodium-dependent transporter [Marinibactrum halimedae]|uniref:Sodium-dependent transporter n=1 Tax=Marinibactrum halimedae TaxID=1444977 RepID=A0AA37T8E4_9GAMM|nr:sodium-dependent transporter [Marinibactrum halimedae]MCD9459022.1 sodium-dependent transporter [Marinibactrum halimedae]GLS26848.1 sodium-dependent transporter [Marinibactrum halimedae]